MAKDRIYEMFFGKQNQQNTKQPEIKSKVRNPVYERLKVAISGEYKNDDLQYIYRDFIKPYILKNNVKVDAISDGLLILSSYNTNKPLTKDSVANIYALILSDKNIFLDFLRTLPNEVLTLFKHLTFAKKSSESLIKNTFKIATTIQKKPYPNSDYSEVKANSMFCFFNPQEMGSWNNKSFEFSLPLVVCEVLVDYFDKPHDYHLKPIETPKNTTYKYENNEDIIEELQSLTAYYHQDNIKTTVNDKITISTANKMRKKLKIKEFFPESDKEFEAVRSLLLAGFISSNSKKTDLGLLALEKLKVWIKQFTDGDFYSLKNLFSNVKGLSYASDNSKSVCETFYKYVKFMEAGQWYDYDKIYAAAVYRNFSFETFNKYDARNYLYYTVEEEGAYRYTNKVALENNIYNQSVTQTTLKGLFFLFASFGIFDIAFNQPDTKELGKTYFSAFDELRYVRLTPLGAYVWGITNDFQAQKTETVATFVLDPDNLFIRASDSPQCEVILQDIAIKVSSNRYKVTALSFLKSCKKKEDIQTKIQYFKNYVCKTPPPNWMDFLNSLAKKTNPLTTVKNTLVFKVPSTDSQLIALMAKDEVLKDLVTKAENYQIIIKKDDYAEMVNRLKEFGYFIE